MRPQARIPTMHIGRARTRGGYALKEKKERDTVEEKKKEKEKKKVENTQSGGSDAKHEDPGGTQSAGGPVGEGKIRYTAGRELYVLLKRFSGRPESGKRRRILLNQIIKSAFNLGLAGQDELIEKIQKWNEDGYDKIKFD